MKRTATVLVLLIATVARAADVPPEEVNWVDFIHSSGVSNTEMKLKASDAIRILDERINENFTDASQVCDSISLDLLEQNQKEWREAATTKCKFLADSYRDGTHSGLAFGIAFIDEQLARIKELREMKAYKLTP